VSEDILKKILAVKADEIAAGQRRVVVLEHGVVARARDVEVQPPVGVMVVDLGRPDDTSKFLFIGQHEELPGDDAIIV
jgi:hypothetical protein